MALVVVASGFSSCRPRPKTKAIQNRARPGGDGRLCRDPFPDPTIVTNFLTMAETLSSWSGSEALLALRRVSRSVPR
jgi:hypothetical protein